MSQPKIAGSRTVTIDRNKVITEEALREIVAHTLMDLEQNGEDKYFLISIIHSHISSKISNKIINSRGEWSRDEIEEKLKVGTTLLLSELCSKLWSTQDQVIESTVNQIIATRQRVETDCNG